MASTYRWMENCLALNALQDARTAHLRSLKPHSHILMLGEGPGRLLEVLVHRMPSARFTVVDQSLGMLEQAETAVNASEYDSERIRWVHGDALNLELCEEPFDLVTTPFFLDCFTQDQLTRLIPWIAGNCSSGASWLLADFQIPNQAGWQRTRAKFIHRLMYFFFRCVTKIPAEKWTDPESLMIESGYRLQARTEFNFGLIRSDIWKREV